MTILETLEQRKKEIEDILVNFGADSHERVEDIIEEREEIETTLRTLGKYNFTSYMPDRVAGFQQAGSCPVCVASTDPKYKPYCSVDCQTHDNLLC